MKIRLAALLFCAGLSVGRAAPPAGSEWIPIPELTDEFDGGELDAAKWHDHNPTWLGRQPGLFAKTNVTVRGGRLQLRAMVEDTALWQAPFDFTAEDHIYALEWNAKVIRWYVDGLIVRELDNKHWHQELAMNFDSETMPEWFGLPDKNTLPSIFSIDYVRSWRAVGDAASPPADSPDLAPAAGEAGPLPQPAARCFVVEISPPWPDFDTMAAASTDRTP